MKLKKIKKMRKLVLTLALALSAVLFANAQDVKKPTSFSWNKASLTEIGCSPEQIQKIADVRKVATEKRKAVDADTSLDEDAKKVAVRALLKERNDGTNAVLTDDQKAKVKEINVKLREEAKAAKAAEPAQ